MQFVGCSSSVLNLPSERLKDVASKSFQPQRPIHTYLISYLGNPADVDMQAEPLPKKSVDVVGDVESSVNGDNAVVAETARVLDHEAEVKLCRKFDTRILPFLSIMCKLSESPLLRCDRQKTSKKQHPPLTPLVSRPIQRPRQGQLGQC